MGRDVEFWYDQFSQTAAHARHLLAPGRRYWGRNLEDRGICGCAHNGRPQRRMRFIDRGHADGILTHRQRHVQAPAAL